MTTFKNNEQNWEWTFLANTFNNEILEHQAAQNHTTLRSMSKAGTPTDHAIMETINSWIKEELFLDFGLATAKDIPKLLDECIYYYNYERPAVAFGYKSPVQHKTEWASKTMVF